MAINGLVVMTPTSIASTGTGNSSSINADGSVDFATCATLSLNGVFTSSYDNYMVVMRHVPSANVNIEMRLRASGTDNSTASSYVRQSLSVEGTSVTSARTTSNWVDAITSSFTAQRNGMTMYLFGPHLAQPTAIRSVNVRANSNADLFDAAATHNQSVSYDGFSLILQSNTLSGLLTVFGFNQ